MKTDKKLSSLIIRKIIFISIIFICLITFGVMASRNDNSSVTIIYPEGYETTVITNRVKVSDILDDNHIIVYWDEVVTPDINSNIDFTKKIVISKVGDKKKVIAEEISDISETEILGKYITVTEKIITEQVEIPYETETKDVSIEGTETTSTVVQRGHNGLKEIKYKVKYQENVEVERNVISETIITEPVNQIVQISTKITAKGIARDGRYTQQVLSASVAGKTPSVVTMNISAYCPCVRCCGKSNGITSSGNRASEWYTVAAGPGYPIGTVIYIPALANKPNGGWFVVEDRGGAISNNRIDIFMGSHAAALLFGRRNYEVQVFK